MNGSSAASASVTTSSTRRYEPPFIRWRPLLVLGSTLAVILGASVAQSADSALQFDGTDDFVRIGDPAELQVTGELTITAWVTPSSVNPGVHIVSRRSDCTSAPGTMGYQLSIQDNQLLVSDGNESNGFRRWSGLVVPSDQLSFVAAVFRASENKIDFYVNDDQSALGVDGFPPGAAPNSVILFGDANGCTPGGLNNYSGLIDEIRIFNRALTPVEMACQFATSIDPDLPGLMGYWKMDEAADSQVVLDSSANGNDGTLGDDGEAGTDDPDRVDSNVVLPPGVDADRNGVPDSCEENPIPAVSEWGMAAMALLLLAAGTLVLRRPQKRLGLDRIRHGGC